MKDVLRKVGLVLTILAVVAGFAVAEATSESAAQQEPLNIRWFGIRGFPGEDTPIQGMLEELISKKVGYPVTLELFGGNPDGELHSTVDMMLAANELPDVFQRFSNWTGQPEFVDQAAATFTSDVYKANMPRQAKRLVEIMNQLGKDEDDTWAIYENADGLMTGAPRIWEWGWIPSGQLWREDKLDELGYKIPTTLAEAEEVFEAFKAVNPDEYALTGRGKTNWQCFDVVFNAFGIHLMWENKQDGYIRHGFATREFREALIVLRRWYEKGYWDPDFVNHGIEWRTNFAEGKYLVTQWEKTWDFDSGEDTIYNNLRDNVPGAKVVPARHLAADENTKPAQAVWDPFLTQLSIFGKHLEADRDKLHKIMNVADLFAMDREVNYLAGNGIEGEHYVLDDDGLPKATDLTAGLPMTELLDKFGYGFYWNGLFSASRPLNSRTQANYQKFVFDEGAIYGPDSINYLMDVTPTAPVDETGERVEYTTKTSWFDLVVDVMTGAQPIEYYDEWLEFYYDSGGRAWEEHANRLFGDK